MCRLTLKYVTSPCRFSRTWFASQPTASKSGERYSKMPSSIDSRSPDKTLSAMGFRRLSVMVSSAIFSSKLLKRSDAPKSRCRAPEQQERHTNITVHGEKRSVELAQVVGFDQRMFVAKQRGDDRDSCPRGPGKREAPSQP